MREGCCTDAAVLQYDLRHRMSYSLISLVGSLTAACIYASMNIYC